jgi:tetratricopeptide (TPR) repeat protein
VAAYYSKKDWNNFYAASGAALAKYPDDLDVLVLTGGVTAHVYDPSDSGAAAKLAQAEGDLKHAIELIPALTKPAGLTDPQFAAYKASEMSLAQRGLGLVDFFRKDYATSVEELQQVTQGAASPDPTDLWTLGSGLQQLKRYDEAADVFEKCAKIPGSLHDACKQLTHQTERDKGKVIQTIWSPPNTDARLASVSATQPCSLPDVLAHAGERAQELVENFPRFTANEKVQYDQLDADSYGPATPAMETAYDYELKASETTDYDYVVSLKQLPGSFLFDESRALSAGAKPLTGYAPNQGLTSLALIFHSDYQGDYNMRCEGLSDWQGTPAWIVHFVQRKDRPIRTRGYITSKVVYPEKLKGRAWIAQDSFQILHIETNLIEPVLLESGQTVDSDAVSVDYGPVEFHGQNVQLWLPLSAETYTQVGRTRVITKDAFSDFALFSVEIHLKAPQP